MSDDPEDPPDLKSFWDRAIAGDLDARNEIVRRCRPGIERVVRRVLGPQSDADERDELVQCVMIELIETLEQREDLLETVEDPEAWIYGLARIHTLSLLREKIRRRARERPGLPETLQTDAGAGTRDMEATYLAQATLTALWAMLWPTLTPQEGRVARGWLQEGLSPREIALRELARDAEQADPPAPPTIAVAREGPDPDDELLKKKLNIVKVVKTSIRRKARMCLAKLDEDD